MNGALQDKLPELVVLTAASAKLVAGVFIRAGELIGGALANDNPFSPSSRGLNMHLWLAWATCTCTWQPLALCPQFRFGVSLAHDVARPCELLYTDTAVPCGDFRNLERCGRGHER